MDEDLRKRLDAVVGLLAVVALLLVGVVVALGGVSMLAVLGLAGGLLVVVTYPLYEDELDGEERVGETNEERVDETGEE